MRIFNLNKGDVIFETGFVHVGEDEKVSFSGLQYDGMDGAYAKVYPVNKDGDRLKREGYDILLNLHCGTEVEPYGDGYILKGDE